MKTVFAPATPLGGAIAIIRITGDSSGSILKNCFNGRVFEPGVLTYCEFTDDEGIVDRCMAVFFRDPKSYTGEDMAEIHCHGSHAVVQRICQKLNECGASVAEPGEFTQRAFINGKLDLTQAEAVMDIVNAGVKAQAKSAISHLSGEFGARIRDIEQSASDAAAIIFAGLDYPDEEIDQSGVRALLEHASSLAGRLISTYERGRLLGDGINIVICGKPNVGKSSLLNALLGDELAIVTSHPGTTRDVISETINLLDLPVRLVDTAGLRQGLDEVEQIGILRAKDAMSKADLALFLVDGSEEVTEADELAFESISSDFLVVLSKSDLPACKSALQWANSKGEAVSASSVSPSGLEQLKEAILKKYENLSRDQSVLVTNARHYEALKKAEDSLNDALLALGGADIDCVSIEVQAALISLGSITGEFVDELVLNKIFSKFCLGK